MELFIYNTTEIIFIAIFGFTFITQLFYYIWLYNRIYRQAKAVLKRKVDFTETFSPVSVIIRAKNDSWHLQNNLPYILEQDYPRFEVIVVNEDSTDDSEDQLKLMEEKYPHLYHTFIPNSARYISRKKLAVTMGVKASQYEWLVFTEPSCRPVSKDWLKTLARNFTSSTQIVLGYSGYHFKKDWFCRKVIFDNLLTAIRYLGFAINKHPYMGIGRNMAYRKDLFYDNKGFSSHLNLQRGEDDLFINETATPFNTRVEIDKNAIVRMDLPQNAREWKEKKISYLITSSYYKGIQRYLSGFETGSRILFYGSWITLLYFSVLKEYWILAGIIFFLFIFRWGFQYFVFNKTAAVLGERKYLFQLPLFDLFQPLYSLRFHISKLFKNKNEFMRK